MCIRGIQLRAAYADVVGNTGNRADRAESRSRIPTMSFRYVSRDAYLVRIVPVRRMGVWCGHASRWRVEDG